MPRVLVTTCLVATCSHSALALTLFTEAKRGDFGPTSAIVRVGADRALQELRPPTCPTTSSLRFALSRHGKDFEDHGEIPLPCAAWSAVTDGFRYAGGDDRAGGISEILYTRHGLEICAAGTGYTPITGPVAYVEAWLTGGGGGSCIYCHNK